MTAEAEEVARLVSSTIKTAIGPTILLGSGSYFDYLDPENSEFTLEDLAYGLGYEGRFCGQSYSLVLKKRAFYSAGQHSVMMSYAVEGELAMQALMHEGGEFVCGDMSGPLKSMNPEYKAIEKSCERGILSKFGVKIIDKIEIKKADIRMLVTERRDLTKWGGEKWSIGAEESVMPYDFTIIPWSPDESSVAFIERYKELTEKKYISPMLQRLMGEANFSS